MREVNNAKWKTNKTYKTYKTYKIPYRILDTEDY